MSHFKPIQDLNEINLSAVWTDATKFDSYDRKVDEKGKEISVNHQGRYYRLMAKKERDYSPWERLVRGLLGIIAGMIAAGSLGYLLSFKTVTKLFTQQKEHIRFGLLIDPALPQKEAPEEAPGEKASLTQQIAQAKEVDQVAPTNGWKQGLGRNETEQTLEAFKANEHTQRNSSLRFLKIVILGDLSPQEMKIIHIVSDYLQAVHGLNTSVAPKPLSLYNTCIRHNPHPQYAIENNLLKILHETAPEESFYLGFTNQDLYPYLEGDTVNFVFGVGNPNTACGLFSTYRLKTDNFEQTLKRLMKLATHEFAHMRGVAHCTEHKCNMQGTNSVQESDQVPLTFCAEDMAKICHLNQWNLKKGYERQLYFFENFFQRYQQQVDFSQEIAHLKKKISKLS